MRAVCSVVGVEEEGKRNCGDWRRRCGLQTGEGSTSRSSGDGTVLFVALCILEYEVVSFVNRVSIIILGRGVGPATCEA